MRFEPALAAASLWSTCSAFTPASTTGTDKLAVQGLLNLAKYELQSLPKAICNTTSGYIREEWSSFTSAQKTSYINAVLCLQSKPSLSNATTTPGAKSRYDDFVAVHISQTLTIHGTVSFNWSIRRLLS